jgi:hypothetical protein
MTWVEKKKKSYFIAWLTLLCIINENFVSNLYWLLAYPKFICIEMVVVEATISTIYGWNIHNCKHLWTNVGVTFYHF